MVIPLVFNSLFCAYVSFHTYLILVFEVPYHAKFLERSLGN